MSRYKKGIISEDLISCYGTGHKKGDSVFYQRIKSIRDKDGFRSTEYEWHYYDENKLNLVRSTKRIIEGLEFIQEEYVK